MFQDPPCEVLFLQDGVRLDVHCEYDKVRETKIELSKASGHDTPMKYADVFCLASRVKSKPANHH
jgi:hypothetical protein